MRNGVLDFLMDEDGRREGANTSIDYAKPLLFYLQVKDRLSAPNIGAQLHSLTASSAQCAEIPNIYILFEITPPHSMTMN
jgi:hypothetical protein